MRMRLVILGIAALLSASCTAESPVSPSAGKAPAASVSTSASLIGNVSPTTDNRAEQVVFSGQVPPGTFTGSGATDVDFWVWCEHGGANNGYAGQCDGSMSIGQLSRGVSGTIRMVPDFDPSLGMDHVMDVQSSDGSIACELRNHLPLSRGQTSTVDVSCTAPTAVNGTFTGAVVITTEAPTT